MVIAVLQIERAHEDQLMGGDLAQRLGLDADLLAMSEIAESLIEQRRRTISRDRRWLGEKRFRTRSRLLAVGAWIMTSDELPKIMLRRLRQKGPIRGAAVVSAA